MRAPTTTTFAILSLLAVRPWTTYELAQQMERSVGTMWSSATSVVYEEPKRLVDRGWATAQGGYTGRRPRTVYEITDDGRAALADWLTRPGTALQVNFEALLKVAFADHGTLDGLRANLTAIRDHAEAERARTAERRREYAESGGPYPHRLPVIALAFRFFEEYEQALLRWVAWAEAAVVDWDGVTPATGAHVPPDAWEHPPHS